MNDLLSRTKQYLANLQDAPLRLDPVQSGTLPLFLSKRYMLRRSRLFDKEWLLAIEVEAWDTGTPKEYRKQLDMIAASTGETIVLVLGAATSTLRNRLVRMSIPFVVPGTQLFLPLTAISLTERYPGKDRISGKCLTPTAQLLLLYQILRGELHDLSSKDIAAKLGCSAMMITKARGELESRGICTVERLGKETRICFAGNGRALWDVALPSLTSPVVKTRWVQWDAQPAEARRAGLTALSDLTLISDDRLPTYALHRATFTKLLETGELREWPDSDGAHAAIQCWSYNPALLSDAPHVDPLSIYLDLRDTHDVRVQGELDSMLEVLPWR
jgi:hypothetical protein